VEASARFRPGDLACPAKGAKAAMASPARRHQELTAEVTRLDAALEKLITHAAPKELLAKQGVAVQVASTLLATAGDNPGRVRKEAASPRCVAPAPSTPPPARKNATDSTAAGTGRPNPRCGGSP
jgi:transposase